MVADGILIIFCCGIRPGKKTVIQKGFQHGDERPGSTSSSRHEGVHSPSVGTRRCCVGAGMLRALISDNEKVSGPHQERDKTKFMLCYTHVHQNLTGSSSPTLRPLQQLLILLKYRQTDVGWLISGIVHQQYMLAPLKAISPPPTPHRDWPPPTERIQVREFIRGQKYAVKTTAARQ